MPLWSHTAHDLCGIRCATAYKDGQQTSAPTPQSLVCALIGCNKPVWVGQNQTPSGYCGNPHRMCARSLWNLVYAHMFPRSEAVKRGEAESCLLSVLIRCVVAPGF